MNPNFRRCITLNHTRLGMVLLVKGLRNLFVSVLKGQQSILYLLDAIEVVWSQNLSLYDREVDFNLVEPTRMYGKMH
jgi:hypothetical protein